MTKISLFGELFSITGVKLVDRQADRSWSTIFVMALRLTWVACATFERREDWRVGDFEDREQGARDDDAGEHRDDRLDEREAAAVADPREDAGEDQHVVPAFTVTPEAMASSSSTLVFS